MKGFVLALAVGWAAAGFAGESPFCRIRVVDGDGGWPVPLVELRTTDQERFVTDNAGVVAFDRLDLMGEEVWLEVIGHGYEVAKDGFGYRGVRVRPVAGGELEVRVARTVPARRVGRLTGGGLFNESRKLGDKVAEPRSGVLGCDSAQNALHEGRLWWIWGDTTLARYPLGIFDSTGATTAPRPAVALEPPLRFEFEHFRDAEGRPRGVAHIPGPGPTWISALASLPDAAGRARLVGSYVKVKPPLEAYEWGLAEWVGEPGRLERARVLWTKSAESPKPPPAPDGHAARWRDGEGKEWVLFGNPLPTLRMAARHEAWLDPAQWERLTPQESLESVSGGRVRPHSGSIAWNGHRGRWVTVFMESGGKPSGHGELWYAEAKEPTGPWGPCVKVVTHDNYTFYNPRIHEEFTPDGGPFLYFEGTYTMQFSGNQRATAAHDYNQVLYRLDLDDPALKGVRR